MKQPLQSAVELTCTPSAMPILAESGPGSIKAAELLRDKAIAERHARRDELVSAGLARDVAEADLYLRTLERRQAGHPVPFAMVRFLDAAEEFLNQRDRLNSLRTEASAAEAQQLRLQAAHSDSITHLANEREHIASLETYIDYLTGGYERGTREIQVEGLAKYGAEILGAREMRRFLLEHVVPELEAAVNRAAADLDRWTASSVGRASIEER